MPHHATGIKDPTEKDFEESKRTLYHYTDMVIEKRWDFATMDSEDIKEILHGANTVLNYLMHPKRHIDEASGSENESKPSKRSRKETTLKRGRDVYSSENSESENESKPSKRSRKETTLKRGRDVYSSENSESENENTPLNRPRKKLRAKMDEREMNKALKAFQAALEKNPVKGNSGKSEA